MGTSVRELFSWLSEEWKDYIPPRWAILAASSLYAFWKFSTWHYGVFKQIGVKGPRPWPLIGTMIPFSQMGLMQHDLEMKRRYGSVVGTYFGRQPAMVIYDLDILKTLLVKDFAKFQNRMAPTIPDYPFSKMLTFLQDHHWKHVRNTLTPTFSTGKLRKMQHQMEMCAETLLTNLQQKAKAGETFDFRDFCGAYTMDVIASTAFGLKIDSHNDPNNQFVRMSNEVFEFGLTKLRTIMFFFFPFLIKPLGKLGFRLFPREVSDFFVSAVNRALEQRKTNSTDQSQVDFLQLMLNAEAEADHEDIEDEDSLNSRVIAPDKSADVGKQSRRGLTHEEVLAQAILFLGAGYETTANTLSFLGYSLAVNNDCQEKLIAEIDDVLQEREHVTFDDINKMPYLDMCVSETLRLYPPGPRTDRVATENTTINGVFIPKGMLIAIPIFAVQNDSEYWPHPERFDPDRFLPEAKATRNPYCYMPFGMGPRSCIGMRLAIMEMKMAIVHILRKFHFIVCDETQIPLKLEKMRMRGADGIKLRVKSRSDQS